MPGTASAANGASIACAPIAPSAGASACARGKPSCLKATRPDPLDGGVVIVEPVLVDRRGRNRGRRRGCRRRPGFGGGGIRQPRHSTERIDDVVGDPARARHACGLARRRRVEQRRVTARQAARREQARGVAGPPQAPGPGAQAQLAPGLGQHHAGGGRARHVEPPLPAVPGQPAPQRREVARLGQRPRQHGHPRVEGLDAGGLALRLAPDAFERVEPVAVAEDARHVARAGRGQHHREGAAEPVDRGPGQAAPGAAAAHLRRQHEAPGRAVAPDLVPAFAELAPAGLDRALEMPIPGLDEIDRQAPLHEIAGARQLAVEPHAAAHRGHLKRRTASLRKGLRRLAGWIVNFTGWPAKS